MMATVYPLPMNGIPSNTTERMKAIRIRMGCTSSRIVSQIAQTNTAPSRMTKA